MTTLINDYPSRWGTLVLATLTNAFVAAAPSMCLPVLFDEISTDLSINLVQVGVIWGIGALPAIVSSLLGGALGDQFGPRRMIILSCVLSGLFGALRGFSTGYGTLLVTMILFGMTGPLVVMNNIKIIGMVFPSRQLGMANGALSMGMALGFLLSSMISATLLSPMLGGWRNVLVAYGALSALLVIPWLFLRIHLPARDPAVKPVTMFGSIGEVLKLRTVWLLGLALMGMSGSVQGVLGYLPLHLRDFGWAPAAADAALAAFHTISLLGVIPIALLSDRLRTRRKILLVTAGIMALGFGLIPFVPGTLIWAAVLMAGLMRDGFMGVFMTNVVETRGVGVEYAGTAVGVVVLFANIGNFIAPPLGNSLAGINRGLPFLFWSGLTFFCLLCIYFASRSVASRNPNLMDRL